MPTISANAAANMAADIYLAQMPHANMGEKEKDKLRLALARNASYFSLDITNRIEGISGGSYLNEKTGFGVITNGNSTNDYKNDVFILLRGTASAYDALTDLNCFTAHSSSGHIVHQGFQESFKSLERSIDHFFLQQRKKGRNIDTVHCVGHSLGGALATLAADWVSDRKLSGSVNLYTFGGPRIGMDPFANHVESKIKKERSFRTFHHNDPVPMIPIWPFLHVFEDDGYYLPRGGFYIDHTSHFMENYKITIGNNDWETLQKRRPPKEKESVEEWLASDDVVGFSASALHMFNRAIGWVINKVLIGAGLVLQTSLSTSAHLLDKLAFLLHQGIKSANALSEWVIRLVKKMAQALGWIIQESTNFTMSFVRQVLQAMSNRVYDLVRQAVDHLK